MRVDSPRYVRAQETRRKVLDAARDLFTERGFERVTIRDVAARAQLSTGAIFSHVPDKDALFEAAMGRKSPMTRIDVWLRSWAAGGEQVPPPDVALQLLRDISGAVPK